MTFGKTGFNVCFKEDEHVHETNVTRNPPSFTAEIWMITLQDLIPDSCNFPLANLQNKGMYNRSDTPGTESWSPSFATRFSWKVNFWITFPFFPGAKRQLEAERSCWSSGLQAKAEQDLTGSSVESTLYRKTMENIFNIEVIAVVQHQNYREIKSVVFFLVFLQSYNDWAHQWLKTSSFTTWLGWSSSIWLKGS